MNDLTPQLDGSGRVALVSPAVADGLTLDHALLAAADDGPAEGAADLRRLRTQLVEARLTLDRAQLAAWVAGRGEALAQRGLESVSLRLADGHLRATFTVRGAEPRLDGTARLTLWPTAHGQLRVLVDDLRLYGVAKTPAPLLAEALLRGLLPTLEAEDLRAGWIQLPCLDEAIVDPLAAALLAALPRLGYRLPGRRGIAPLRIALDATRATIEYGGGEPDVEPPSLDERLQAGDSALRRGALDEAIASYRAAATGGGSPRAGARLLALLVAMPEHWATVLALATEQLARESSLAALLACGAIEGAREEEEAAAARYLQGSVIAERTGAVEDELLCLQRVIALLLPRRPAAAEAASQRLVALAVPDELAHRVAAMHLELGLRAAREHEFEIADRHLGLAGESRTALEARRDVLMKRDDDEALSLLLERLLERLPVLSPNDLPARVRAWLDLAAARFRMRQTEAAVDAYRRALALDPEGSSADEARDGLGESCFRLGRWDDARAALEALFWAGREPRVSRALRLGAIAQQQRDAPAARAFYHAVLDQGAAGIDTVRAHDALIALAEAGGGSPRETVRALLDAAGDTRTRETPARRADRTARAAAILHRGMKRTDEARRLLERAVETEPHHLGLLDALEEIAGAANDWPRVASVLAVKAEVVRGHAAERRAILGRLAALRETRLGQIDEARATWRQLLELAPDDAAALHWLARDAGQRGDEIDEATYLARLDQLAARLGVRPRSGEARGRRQPRPVTASPPSKPMPPRARPRPRPAVAALEGAGLRAASPPAATQRLAPAPVAAIAARPPRTPRQAADPVPAEETTTPRAAPIPPPPPAPAVPRAPAAAAGHPEDTDADADAKTLERPRPDASRVSGRAGITDAVFAYRTARREVTAEDPPAEATVEHWMRLGEAAEIEGRHTEAGAHYRRAAFADPLRIEAHEALMRQAVRRDDPTVLHATLLSLLAALPAEAIERRAEVQVLLGDLCNRASDATTARSHFEAALRIAPNNAIAIERLANLAAATGEWARAAELLGELSFRVGTPRERADILYRQSEIYRLHLGQPQRASDGYLRAFDLSPTHAPTLRRLVALYFAQHDLASAREVVAELGALGAPADEVAAEIGVLRALDGDRAGAESALQGASPDAIAEAIGRLDVRGVAELDRVAMAATSAMLSIEAGDLALRAALTHRLIEAPGGVALRVAVARLAQATGETQIARAHWATLHFLDPGSGAEARLAELPAPRVHLDVEPGHPGATGPLHDALRVLGPLALGLVLPRPGAMPEVAWGARLQPLAHSLGVPTITVASIDPLDEPALIEPIARPRLLLRRSLLADPAQAIFAAGRALHLFRAGAALVAGRRMDDLAALLAGAASIFNPQFRTQSPGAKAWAAELRALPLKPHALSPGTLAFAREALVAAATCDLAAEAEKFVMVEPLLANRVAYARTGDLPAALRLLADQLPPMPRLEALRSPAIADLITFATSRDVTRFVT